MRTGWQGRQNDLLMRSKLALCLSRGFCHPHIDYRHRQGSYEAPENASRQNDTSLLQQNSSLSLTGSSGEFLIPDLLRLEMEGPGLPGLSLNKSSRSSIGGDTDGMANDRLNTPRNWFRSKQYQIITNNA